MAFLPFEIQPEIHMITFCGDKYIDRFIRAYSNGITGSRLEQLQCFCGSNRSYGVCHKPLELQTPVTRQELNEALNDCRKRVGECYHPEAPKNCSPGISQAHTISRSSTLSKIADGNEVYYINPLNRDGNRAMKLNREVIKKASIFPGFCSFHDGFFADIDSDNFLPTRYTSFLHTYRATAKEIHDKKILLAFAQQAMLLSCKGLTLEHQLDKVIHFRLHRNGHERGLNWGLTLKKNLKRIYQQSNYAPIHYMALKVSGLPNFVCSGTFSPEHDFSGNTLQVLTGLVGLADQISINVSACQNCFYIVLSWFGDSQVNTSLLQSFMAIDEDHRLSALTELVFNYLSNTYIAPRWWDAISEDDRQYLNKKMHNYPSMTHPVTRRAAPSPDVLHENIAFNYSGRLYDHRRISDIIKSENIMLAWA